MLHRLHVVMTGLPFAEKLLRYATAKEPPAARTASAFDSPAFNYTMDAEDDIT